VGCSGGTWLTFLSRSDREPRRRDLAPATALGEVTERGALRVLLLTGVLLTRPRRRRNLRLFTRRLPKGNGTEPARTT
jgi:hypothetical protein